MAKKLKAPPAVADTEAMRTAEKAAAAVGLTVPELCDLLVDNQITSIPNEDGINKRYTLEDLGNRLRSDLAGVPKTKRAEWFNGLSKPQKTALIVNLRTAGYSPIAIVNDLQVSESYVRKTYNEYATELGAQVVGVRLDTMVGQMQLACERAMQMASEAGDHSALWRIQKELVATLQSIGIVDRAAHRVEVSHHLNDENREEIKHIIALEQKKAQRALEVKQFEEEKDAVPSVENVPDEIRDLDEFEDDE